MAPLDVTAIMYFLRPNFNYCSSDIVNLDKVFKSIDVILLKSNNDLAEFINIFNKSENSYLTLKAKLNGARANFYPILI